MPTTGNIPLANAIDDQTITANLWNTEFANVGTLMDAQGAGGYSSTDAQMQVQTNPYPGSVTSHAASIAGELERLRYQLAQILGTDYWYKPADISLATANDVLTPVGGIIDYPSATPPNSNWHLADGTAINRVTYATLFTLIGTTFGSGDGVSTFNLPNYTDKMSIAAGNLYALAATGGSTTKNLAHSHTVNSHTHDLSNHTHDLANHTHSVPALTIANGPANQIADTGTGGYVLSNGGIIRVSDGMGTTNKTWITNQTSSATSGTPSSNTSGTPSANVTSSVAPGTNSQLSASQDVMNPYIAMFKMIRVL